MPAGTTRKLKDDEIRLLGNFVDLLEKMLSLEPQKRPLPKVSFLCFIHSSTNSALIE